MSLQTPALHALEGAARAAWKWWLAEISGLIGSLVGQKLGVGRLPIARLRPDGGYEVVAADGANFASPAAGFRVAVRLPSEWVLRQRVDLPLAAAPRARDAVGFQLDRLSPFPPDDVFFAVQVVRLDPETQTARVEVAIAPRARVEASLARLRTASLAPVRVEAEGAPRPFLFGAATPTTISRASQLARGLTAAAVILAALAAPIGIGVAERQQADMYEAQAKALRSDAERARKLTAEIAATRKAEQEWRAFEDAPAVSVLLERLTERVDDGAWVFSLEYDRKNIALRGIAHDVPALLGRLSTPPFGAAELVGAIVSGTGREGDRFDVRLPILETQR